MTFGSVCSGIEAASVAWEPLGWRPAFFAEIDPAPCAVLAHRFPGVPNLGDFTTIGADQSIDLLVGGTPCQDFSVAGLRKGMDGARGGLTVEFLRLAGRLRPEWLVWENVPGVLSIDAGRAFGAFLGGLAQLGYGWAYRVLDAQHFGVPQRRRRVFVVGHLGDWRRAAAVLFERSCLSGNPPPSREEGARFAPTTSPSLRGQHNASHRLDSDAYVAGTLNAIYAKQSHNGMVEMANGIIAHSLRGEGFDASEDGTGRGTPLVPVAFNPQAGGKQTSLGFDPSSRISGTLNISQTPAVAFQCHGSDIGRMGTLRSGHGDVQSGVPFIVNAAESCAKASHARESQVARCLDSTGSFANAQGGTVVADFRNMATADVSPTLQVGGHGASPSNTPHVQNGSAVRRLTPIECERLQGFPDNWTLVPHRGKPMADGPRYKMLGNSMAIPPMRWIGERIDKVASLAS